MKTRTSFLILCFLFMLNLLQAQDYRSIDSLRKLIPLKSDSDTNKVFLISGLAFEYSYVSLDSGLVIAKIGLALAEKQNYLKGKSAILNVMGTIYFDKADYKMAMECYTEARKISEKLNDERALAVILANASNTHNALHDFPSARKALFECIRICEKLGLTHRIFPAYLTLGNFYYDQSNIDSALYYFNLALKVPSSDRSFVGVLHGSIALCYKYQKKYDKAEKELLLALHIAKELNSDYYKYEYLSTLGRLYNEQNRLKEAEPILLEALQYFRSSALKKEEIGALEGLFELYKAKNDPEKALQYHELYFKLNDSINNAETNKIAREFEKKYEDEKKKAEIEKLNLEKTASEAENERKGQLLVFAIIGCTLILIALGYAIYAFINKRKANIELQVLHKEVSNQKNELFEKNKNITDSIHYAQRIQKALLSSRSYIKENVTDFLIIHKPKDIVSGDFYWAQRSGDDLFFMLADCTGHGVPGAFMSLLGVSYLNELVVGQKVNETDKILNGLRANIINALTDNTYEMKDGMDGVLCRFNFKKLQLQYSAANNKIVIVRDNKIVELKGDKMPVGRSPRDKESFTAQEFILQKNDLVYLFTDGYPDQFGGPRGKKLKEKALKEVLLKWHHLPLEQQESSLTAFFDDWKKDLEQVDDVTFVGFKV